MTDSHQHLSGHCFCTAVKWSYKGPQGQNLVCHCIDCQRATSAPFAAFICLSQEHVQVTGPINHFESSPSTHRGFCQNCGTRMYFRSNKWPDEIHFLATTLDDPSDYSPTAQVCLDTRLKWLDTLDQISGHCTFQKDPTEIE